MYIYFLLMIAVGCQPFILKQLITDKAQTDSIIEISGGSEVFVVTSLNEPLSIFINQGNQFVIFDHWTLFSFDAGLIYPFMKVTAITVTNDAQWTMGSAAVEGSNFTGAGVATYIPQLNRYDSVATVVFGSARPNALALTDDHLWAMTGHQDGTVRIHHFSA